LLLGSDDLTEQELKPFREKRGSVLKSRREQLDVSVKQVACGVGVSENRIKRLEKGEPVMDGYMMERTYIYFLELVKSGVCPFSVSLNFDEMF